MIFRSLDATKDWRFGAGKANFTRNNDAIMLGIATTLRTFLSECFFNPDIGVDWFNLINERNKDVVILTIKSEIMKCYGVVDVNEIVATYDVSRSLEIKYNINTLYESYVEGTVTI